MAVSQGNPGTSTGMGPLSATDVSYSRDWDPNLGMYGGSQDASAANQQQLQSQAGDIGYGLQATAGQSQQLLDANTQSTQSGIVAANQGLNQTARTNVAQGTAANQGFLDAVGAIDASASDNQYQGTVAQGRIAQGATALNNSASINQGTGTNLTRPGMQQANTLGQQFGATRLGQVMGPSNIGTPEQQQAMQGLYGFAGQQAPDSVAQAQLRQQADQNAAAAMAMASSGRGGGANAAMQMQGMSAQQNALAEGNQSAAILRAQEEQAWRNQQMQALGASAQVGADLQGQAQGQQQLSLAGAQAAAQTQLGAGALQNQYLQSGQGYGQLGLGYSSLAAQQQQAALAGQVQANAADLGWNQLGAQQQQLGLQGLAQGNQAQLGWGTLAAGQQQLSNQNTLTGLGYGNQNATNIAQTGMQAQLAAGQFEQGFAGMGQQQLSNESQNTVQGNLGIVNAQNQQAMFNAEAANKANHDGWAMALGGLGGMLGV